jgi:acyl-CoA thioesterase-1
LAKLQGPTAVKAFILGDSVAESVGATNKDLSSWYTLVANDLKGKYPGTMQWAFKTTSKATMTDALNALKEVPPETDLVILCVGRNDWATLTTDAFKQKYEQFVAELKVKNPNSELFLVVEPPVKDIATNNQTFPYRQVILDLSKEHQLPVIDAWIIFINDPVPLTGLLADGVNPNDKGYGILAGEVVKKFQERLLITP